MFKQFFHFSVVLSGLYFLSGCSTNPATGESQFTAFMPAEQESQIGAQEHKNIIKEYGLYKHETLQKYVREVGAKVAQKTERPDVSYQFYLLDSPIVNAFALPGGYVYLSRGLVALANSESEMASVLAHEVGHITARHSAERYSQGVVTAIGSSVLSAAIGSDGISTALGLGSNLYMSSYSRGQENQADSLGIRYLNRSGYDTAAMSSFLANLRADTALEAKIDGKPSSDATNYFATHPATSERVSKTKGEARDYIQGGAVGRDAYLRLIDGITYGDSASQGFARGNTFYHPEIGFMFSVPKGFEIINQPDNVIASDKSTGALMVFDLHGNKNALDPVRFMRENWIKKKKSVQIDAIKINGMRAATSVVEGTYNGKAAHIRFIAVQWTKTQVARFQIITPQWYGAKPMEELKRASYSFKRMSASDKRKVKPYRIRVVTAKTGDTVSSLSQRMVYDDYREDRFRVLNGLSAKDGIVSGGLYKIVVQ